MERVETLNLSISRYLPPASRMVISQLAAAWVAGRNRENIPPDVLSATKNVKCLICRYGMVEQLK